MITKDEQSKLRNTIALSTSMVNGGEQHSEHSRKEVSEALSIVNNLPIHSSSEERVAVCLWKPTKKWQRPKIATITIQWIDECGEEHIAKFSEATLEEAETLLSLMTGNLCEGDLQP